MEDNLQRQLENTQEAISQRMDFSQVALLQTVNACQADFFLGGIVLVFVFFVCGGRGFGWVLGEGGGDFDDPVGCHVGELHGSRTL